MAAQQPNYAAIGNHLHGLANEVVLLPTAAPTAPITLQQFENLMLQLQQQIQHDIQQLGHRLVGCFHHIPLQLYNSELPKLSPLKYPPGVFQNFMPATKADLEQLTAQQCQHTADALGLPALPPGTLVEDQRHQIQIFLGAL